MNDVYIKVNLWKKSGRIFKFLTTVISGDENDLFEDGEMKVYFHS